MLFFKREMYSFYLSYGNTTVKLKQFVLPHGFDHNLYKNFNSKLELRKELGLPLNKEMEKSIKTKLKVCNGLYSRT